MVSPPYMWELGVGHYKCPKKGVVSQKCPGIRGEKKLRSSPVKSRGTFCGVDVTEHFTLFGSAGTGKTTFGIDYCVRNIRAGIRPEEIAYLSFTKAAAREAVRRIVRERPQAERQSFSGFRTLHAWCYREMQRAHANELSVVRPPHWKKFAQETGMDLTPEDTKPDDLGDMMLGAMVRKGEHDVCRAAYSLGRLTASSITELDRVQEQPSETATELAGYVNWEMYRYFVDRYEAFKRTEGLVDFADMLEWAARNAPEPKGIRKVVVDEAQDCSPLLHLIMDRIFDGRVDSVLRIGDDLQAIYRFAGVDPTQFLREASRGKAAAQTLTHRFGDRIVAISREIAQRIQVRQDREIKSAKPDREHRAYESGSFEPDPRPGLILHRHVAGCREIGKRYMLAGVPFRNERGKDPLASASKIAAFEALDKLARGDAVNSMELQSLFSAAMKSFYVNQRTKEKHRLLVHGGVKKASKLAGVTNLRGLIDAQILTDLGARTIRERLYGFLKGSEDLAYYERLVKNGYGLDARGPVITTIHGSKGRQADRVQVFVEMSPACWSDPDGEHRLAYVAATRTRGELEICRYPMIDWGRTRYYYPIEEEAHAGA